MRLLRLLCLRRDVLILRLRLLLLLLLWALYRRFILLPKLLILFYLHFLLLRNLNLPHLLLLLLHAADRARIPSSSRAGKARQPKVAEGGSAMQAGRTERQRRRAAPVEAAIEQPHACIPAKVVQGIVLEGHGLKQSLWEGPPS